MSVKSGDEQVLTSIFKTPVNGTVAVRWTNLEGDQQSDLRVHGGTYKAVYAYSVENIEYWRRHLERDDLGHGTFGENLTVEGLTDPEIAVGDELAIGTARFVVTQPRIPCFKLGIRLEMPEIVKMFHWSGRNGFYLRVLHEGQIEVGDEIQISRAREPRMTIAELVQLSNATRITPEQLERILALDALTPSWKEDFREKAGK